MKNGINIVIYANQILRAAYSDRNNDNSKNEFLRNKYTSNFGNLGKVIAQFLIQRKAEFRE